MLLNPTVPIPEGATAVHGITDADVQGKPTFADMADALLETLARCDLAGFNLKRFDLKMLCSELRRCDRTLPMEGIAVIDAMAIYHHFERRDLAAAVKFYCGREHEGHRAVADVQATADVLDAQLERYPLPSTVAEVDEWTRGPDAVDLGGCFIKLRGVAGLDGLIVFAFGKYKGHPLDEIAQRHPDYLQWMLQQDFFEDAKALVRKAMEPAPTNDFQAAIAG